MVSIFQNYETVLKEARVCRHLDTTIQVIRFGKGKVLRGLLVTFRNGCIRFVLVELSDLKLILGF